MLCSADKNLPHFTLIASNGTTPHHFYLAIIITPLQNQK
jgi:hypothetical protein